MKTSSIFLGVFFVLVGLLLLVLQLDLLTIELEFAKYLWPLVIIFIGISMFNLPKSIKFLLSGLSAAILALFIFGLFSSCKSCSSELWDNIALDEYSETVLMELDSNLQLSNLLLDGAAGNITIMGTTDKFFDLNNNFHRSNNRIEKIDSTSNNLYLDLLFSGENKNKASTKLKLNPDIVWNMNFNAAALNIDADLRMYNLRNFHCNSAATNLKLKIGEKSDTVNIVISSALSNLSIEIPKIFSAKLTGNKTLSNFNIEGFEESSQKGVYFTDNYGKTNQVVYIDLQADLSKVKFKRN